MEIVEEVAAAPPCYNNDLSSPVAKGKRTKRQRPHSPIPFTLNNSHRLSPAFSAADDDSTTTAEEDTARFLILLSRGTFLNTHKYEYSSKQNNRRPQTANSAADKGGAAASGGGMYACKTCGRVFSSFQALGGHRTSHKKPKNDKKMAIFDDDFTSPSSKKRMPPSLSLQLSSTAIAGGGGGRQQPYSRIHECSYCGAEFSSGQALGGHMRRHRAGPTSPLPSPAPDGVVAEAMPPEPKKVRNGLSLDLNFPAPEDENQRLGYGGARLEKMSEKLVMSTISPTLVD